MADIAPQLIAAIKGDKGLYPVNGGYVSTVAYRKDTILRDNGSQWRALQLVPPGTPPAEGAYWTKFIDGTPVADAAQVAADCVLSQAAAATASASLDSVSALALLVGGYATSTQINAQSAAAVSGLANLSAAARAILLDTNTVAAHVYDTTRDDDPEWTSKVNSSLTTAPLNMATRGSKAQHPRLMVIAALGSYRQIVIYDADDPTCPMWWTLNEGATNLVLSNTVPLVTAITARNGLILIGETNAGILAIDLVLDRATVYRQSATPNCGAYQGNLAEANSGKGLPGTLPPWFDNPSLAILNGTVNHLAMTVLPQTAPNPNRLGMRNPICAYATAGGAGVLREDGVNVSSAATTAMGRVSFDRNGTLYATAASTNSTVWIYDPPAYLSASFAHAFLHNATTPSTMVVTPTGPSYVRGAGNKVAIAAAAAGLTLLGRNRGGMTNSSVAYIDDWRNTGHQVGASKLAYSESARMLSALQSSEIVTNGKFDTNILGWIDYSSGTGYTPPAWDATNGGQLLLNRVDGNNCARVRQELATPLIGQTYGFSVTARIAGCTFRLGTAIAGNQIIEQAVAAGSTVNIYFRAASAITHVLFFPSSNGATTAIDDVSTRVVIADFSPAGNHGEIIGTINRAPVAAGAELACWQDLRTSGGNASVSNNLGGLNIGTGDFCISVWYKRTNSAAAEALMHFTDEVGGPSDDTGTNVHWRLYIISSGIPFFGGRASGGIFGYSGSVAVPTGAWQHIVVLRRGARVELYANGALFATGTQAGSLSNSGAKLLLGAQFINGVTNSNRLLGSMALPRLSIGSAPSPVQVTAMYAEEVQMFKPNAKCLLQGGSGVQDIAHDPDVDLLYVAKSAGGTDVFQGLVSKGTILSTTSINKFSNSGFGNVTIGGPGVGMFGGSAAMPAVTNGVSQSLVGAGPGYVDIQVSGTPNATGNFSWSPATISNVAPGENWTFSMEMQLIAGSLTNFQSLELREDRRDASFNTVGSTGATPIAPNATNVRYSSTATAEANTTNIALRWIVRYSSGAPVNATFRLRRPQMEKASAFTMYVDGMTDSNNHKQVSAHDGHVVITTATGVDVILPALPLRSGVRARRAVVANDPNVGSFNGRVTVDATPTFIGDPIYVPEGGKVDAIVSVTAAVPGGTATELLTTLLKVRANRDIGAPAATVFYSVISGTPSLPDRTTGTMDLIVASMGGGWIGVRATGKAATTIEWFGEQRLTRAA